MFSHEGIETESKQLTKATITLNKRTTPNIILMSEIKYFTYLEIKEILKMKMPWRTRALFAFQYASGCRIGELIPYVNKHKVSLKDKHEKPIENEQGEIQYEEWQDVSQGLLKSNIKINEEEGIIEWSMPNFKVKNEAKKTKFPFVLKQETIFWNIIKIWVNGSQKLGVNPCQEQVFNIRQAHARTLIRTQIQKYAKKTGKEGLLKHASHAIRRSRGTHLAELFEYTAYEIKEALGHSSLQSGVHYVATAQRKQKMKRRLLEMKEKNGEIE